MFLKPLLFLLIELAVQLQVKLHQAYHTSVHQNHKPYLLLFVWIEYKDENGERLIVETTTSWCYVGAGLRLTLELLGPEYSLAINTLDSGVNLFFSRNVHGETGEDLVEKQNAEMGLMPIVSNEAADYGYEGENRHMVQSFLAGKRPMENFSDGLNVTELLMAAYKSAEEEKTIPFPPPDLETFIPAVARGEWNPKKR